MIFFDEFCGLPQLAKISDFGRQSENIDCICSWSAAMAVWWGGEGGGDIEICLRFRQLNVDFVFKK